MTRYKQIFCFVPDGRPYMIRWRLLDHKILGVYVHKFLESDEAVYHDHPWSFVSLILWNGYHEHLSSGIVRFRGLFSLRFVRAEKQHYVRLVRSPTWTLVIRFRRRRDWGFQVPGVGWVANREYFQEKEKRVPNLRPADRPEV